MTEVKIPSFHELEDFEPNTGHLHCCIHRGCDCASLLYLVADEWRAQVVAVRAQQRDALERADAAEAAIRKASEDFAAVGFRGQAAHLRQIVEKLEQS